MAFCNQLGTPGGPVLLHPPEQWFLILLMLQPFSTVPHVVLKPLPVTHTIKSFSLLLCNCNFATGVNWNVNSFWGWGFAKGVQTHRLRTTRGPPLPVESCGSLAHNDAQWDGKETGSECVPETLGMEPGARLSIWSKCVRHLHSFYVTHALATAVRQGAE